MGRGAWLLVLFSSSCARLVQFISVLLVVVAVVVVVVVCFYKTKERCVWLMLLANCKFEVLESIASEICDACLCLLTRVFSRNLPSMS